MNQGSINGAAGRGRGSGGEGGNDYGGQDSNVGLHLALYIIL